MSFLKEKRRREEGKHRSSVSPNKGDKDEAHKAKKGTENVVRDPKVRTVHIPEKSNEPSLFVFTYFLFLSHSFEPC